MANGFPYIPPFSPDDPPSRELLSLFLQAVADVTEAFRELRDEILPACRPHHIPLDQIHAWIAKWHLDFEDHELREPVFCLILEVLSLWQHDEAARAALRMDSFLEHPIPILNKTKPLVVKIEAWNPFKEGYESYSKRIHAELDDLFDEQKREIEADLKRYDCKPYVKRATKRPPIWDFEWLALSVCRRWSAAKIAHWTKQKKATTVTRDVVKKALQSLRRDLRIETGELRD